MFNKNQIDRSAWQFVKTKDSQEFWRQLTRSSGENLLFRCFALKIISRVAWDDSKKSLSHLLYIGIVTFLTTAKNGFFGLCFCRMFNTDHVVEAGEELWSTKKISWSLWCCNVITISLWTACIYRGLILFSRSSWLRSCLFCRRIRVLGWCDLVECSILIVNSICPWWWFLSYFGFIIVARIAFWKKQICLENYYWYSWRRCKD